MGGYNPGPGEVLLYADPARPDLDSVLWSELLPQLAHEVHHAMRRRAMGYGTTLLQAAVSEGLADHFSLEASGGITRPWAVALARTWMRIPGGALPRSWASRRRPSSPTPPELARSGSTRSESRSR
jgi:hypothetical protein